MVRTLEKLEYEMNNCFRCSHCKFVPWAVLESHRFSKICPSLARYKFHAYSGSGKIQMALGVHQERIKEWTDEMLKILYTCTNCGACHISCRTNNYLTDLNSIIYALKYSAVLSGAAPLPAHKEYTESIEKRNNPYNEAHENRFDWMPEEVKVNEKADVIYWTGCTSSYRRTEIARATVKVLNKIGVDFMVLGDDETCCGSPIYQTGQYNKAKEIARNVFKKIRKSGAKKILTSCAGCYGMFKTKYPAMLKEFSFEVVNLAEVLDEKIKRGELEFKNELLMKVTYHDPCHLGRGSEFMPEWKGEWKLTDPHIFEPVPERPVRMGLGGCYEAPRNVLKAIPGVELVEMERIKEYAWCCGAGGGAKAAFPDFAIWAAKERIIEAEATGAEILTSHCPFCSTNLKDAIAEVDSNIKFYDIAEIVLMTLTKEGE